jgi:hypothetical protein
MTAGLLHTGRILRFSYPADDDQGGALPTGTTLYEPVFARIHTEKPTLALLEQGLETPELFSAILQPGGLDLRHNDQYEVTGPNISPYKGLKFVIISLQSASVMDERKYQRVVMRRYVIAHSNNLQ